MIRLKRMILVLGLVLLASCAAPPSLSFNGMSIHPDVKTISVAAFSTDAPTGPPTLGPDFTERLRNYYRQNTRLALIPDNGDMQVEGAITSYEVSPVAALASQQGRDASGRQETLQQIAGQQRLTIIVQLQFTHSIEPDKDFKQDFSFYADFDGNQSLQAVENRLIDDIFKQLILEIFNKTVADW